MAVVALPLGAGVSLTLIRDADGWRFQSWSLHSAESPAPPPAVVDTTRHFPTPEAAAEYFRSIWPR